MKCSPSQCLALLRFSCAVILQCKLFLVVLNYPFFDLLAGCWNRFAGSIQSVIASSSVTLIDFHSRKQPNWSYENFRAKRCFKTNRFQSCSSAFCNVNFIMRYFLFDVIKKRVDPSAYVLLKSLFRRQEGLLKDGQTLVWPAWSPRKIKVHLPITIHCNAYTFWQCSRYTI